MAKVSAKNGVILIGGGEYSSYAMAYDAQNNANRIDVTGFTDGSQNFIPGLPAATITADMFWSYSGVQVHEALRTLGTTGQVTILPEGSTAGNQCITMPVMQSNYNPGAVVTDAIKIGTLTFDSYGTGTGLENASILYHGTTTNSYTGTGVLDVTAAAATATCGATLHIWGTALAADTYVIKVQDSADSTNGVDGTWADLVTFTLNGSALGSERVIVARGTVDKYRKVVATRTGSAGNTLSFTVVFWRGAN